jgi:hypothetical protein
MFYLWLSVARGELSNKPNDSKKGVATIRSRNQVGLISGFAKNGDAPIPSELGEEYAVLLS